MMEHLWKKRIREFQIERKCVRGHQYITQTIQEH